MGAHLVIERVARMGSNLVAASKTHRVELSIGYSKGSNECFFGQKIEFLFLA